MSKSYKEMEEELTYEEAKKPIFGIESKTEDVDTDEVTSTMRHFFFENEGRYASDEEILIWFFPKENKPFSPTKDFESDFVVGTSYKHLQIDTVARSKMIHTKEQQKAICQFMIDKYLHRDKGQDRDDIIKIKFYTEWLMELTND